MNILQAIKESNEQVAESDRQRKFNDYVEELHEECTRIESVLSRIFSLTGNPITFKVETTIYDKALVIFKPVEEDGFRFRVNDRASTFCYDTILKVYIDLLGSRPIMKLLIVSYRDWETDRKSVV